MNKPIIHVQTKLTKRNLQHEVNSGISYSGICFRANRSRGEFVFVSIQAFT